MKIHAIAIGSKPKVLLILMELIAYIYNEEMLNVSSRSVKIKILGLCLGL